MPKPDFAKATYVAQKVLLIQSKYVLPLDVINMQFDKDITIIPYTKYERITKLPLHKITAELGLTDGFTVRRDNSYYIYYNDSSNPERRIWTIAHEIGHIYLEHEKDNGINEIEAHSFAAQLLMPDFLIREFKLKHGCISEEILMEVFGVNYTAAQKKIETLRRRGPYIEETTPSEAELLARYKSFLDENAWCYDRLYEVFIGEDPDNSDNSDYFDYFDDFSEPPSANNNLVVLNNPAKPAPIPKASRQQLDSLARAQDVWLYDV